MNPHRASYWKTALGALVAGIVVLTGSVIVMIVNPGNLVALVCIVGAAIGVSLLWIACGGLLVLYRDHMLANGRKDLFLALNDSLSEEVLLRAHESPAKPPSPRRRAGSTIAGRVGERVRIRPWSEIRATLDEAGCMEGLPFMPEMVRFCGTTATIFRYLDKVYDYGGKKDMRRLDGTVLLAGLRCDGSSHDGCQARCQLLWKLSWLEPELEPSGRTVDVRAEADGVRMLPVRNAANGKYVCQFTQLVRASTPMKAWDPRQDLRPLLVGNVSLGAFLVALLTRTFNGIQRLRVGIGFPALPPVGGLRGADFAATPVAGDRVRVRAREDIAAALDSRIRNRGLWFDVDMLKHSGRRYTVLGRVEKLIDDATGEMRHMKGSCVILDGVVASGEFLRFCAQNEYVFWREAWLMPDRDDPQSPEPERAVNS